ncbi:MAG: PDR/VanB family oxidoreductase [Thermomicrobiales bacterium]
MREFRVRVEAIIPHGGRGRGRVNDRDRVREFILAPLGGEPLPSHAPGAHLFVHAGTAINAYSLLDDGVLPSRYRIAVQRMDRGGGSDWLHANVQPGDILTVTGPKAAFLPVPDARHSLLIAAGIGITPILAHAHAAVRWGRPFSVIHADHDPEPPLLAELASLAGDRLTCVRHRDALRDAVATALRRQPVGSHAFACGPTGFLDWFLDEGATAGWVPERLHIEAFAAPEPTTSEPFIATLGRSGIRIEVPSDVTLLAALDAAGVTLPRMCTRGVCGECEVRVRAGMPDHRDLIISRDQRPTASVMYPCVSRALSPGLELDL